MALDRMQLTTQTFNLSAALLNIINPTSAALNYSQELLKWLSRQGIDEGSFEECAKLARGIAYPNANGSKIRDSISKADDRLSKIKMCPLPLIFSGSLGRIVARDPEFCYMVSTVASLVVDHDLKDATETVCCMILDQDTRGSGTYQPHSYKKTSIRAVMSKIVDSIYLNVVNAGHSAEPLPFLLRHLHSHSVDPVQFAATVMRIQRASGDVVLTVDRFQGDVTVWLLNHFEGYLEISVLGKILFSQALGPKPQRLSIIVKKDCFNDIANGTCTTVNSKERILLTEVVGDSMSTLLSTIQVAPVSNSSSLLRQPLYSTENLKRTRLTTRPTVSLNPHELNYIMAIAKQISIWLLHIPIMTRRLSQSGLDFKVDLNYSSGDRQYQKGKGQGLHDDQGMCIADLLDDHPTISHIRTGMGMTSGPVFQPFEDYSSMEEGYTPENIVNCFPLARALLDEIQPRCACPNCTSKGPLQKSKKGCLRFSAVAHLFTLLAHAISDGFGAEDVSGKSDMTSQLSGMVALFGELIFTRSIRWDTWFRVVICTVTGCPSNFFDEQYQEHLSASERNLCAGVQYGSLVIHAPWLDFSQLFDVKGCFGLRLLEGNVRGIAEDLALIQPEIPDSDAESDLIWNAKLDQPVAQSDQALHIDDIKVKTQIAIFRAGSATFRVMIIVRTGSHLKIINPSTVFSPLFDARILHFKRKPCQLDHRSESPIPTAIYDFDDILTHYPASSSDDCSIRLTKILDQPAKINIALRVCSSGSIILRDWNSCLTCAIAEASRYYGRPRTVITYTTPPAHNMTMLGDREAVGEESGIGTHADEAS
ncbi:hypothetical protein MMC16_007284 [Acarospora aff. strigata]|nr:hypothetical protein [Acarospora aff. strigata]